MPGTSRDSKELWEHDNLKNGAKAMTLTINLSDEQATALQARASAEGLSSVEAWIQKLAEQAQEKKSAGSRQQRHISEIIRENMSRVPPEILATMPNDGASEHDHYIYGLPKRNP